MTPYWFIGMIRTEIILWKAKRLMGHGRYMSRPFIHDGEVYRYVTDPSPSSCSGYRILIIFRSIVAEK